MHVGASCWLQTGEGYTVMVHLASELIEVEEPAASLKISCRGLCHACALPNVPVLSFQEPPFLVPLHVPADLGQIRPVQIRHLLAGHSK